MAGEPSDSSAVPVAWDYGVRVWLPVLCAALSSKVLRIVESVDGAPFAIVEGLRPELFLVVGLALANVAALRLAPDRMGRIAVSLFGFCVALVVLFGEAAGFMFHKVTGSYIDAPLAGFAFARFAELWTVVSSEVQISWVPIVLVAIWLGAVLLGRPWNATRHAPRQVAPLAGVGALLVLLSIPAPFMVASRAQGRAVLVHFLWSAIRADPIPVTEVVDPDAWKTASLSPRAERPFRNAVVIWLESTSFTATTLFDPELKTTPFLAELAERSLVAESAWTVVPHSTKSTVPIFCGVPPKLITPVEESERLDVKCLPHLLKAQGYRSLMLRSATRHFEGWDGLIANLGFDEFLPMEELDTTGFEVANYFGYEDDVMLPRSEQWLRAVGDQPFLVSYMTGTAHHDYQVPKRYPMQTFDAVDEERNRYLNAIYYTDQFVKQVIEQYQALGLYEETVFVMVGDHGEAFGQHGRKQHDGVPYDEVARVPLLVHAPGLYEDGRVADGPASHLDIMPTLADLLGFDLEAPHREGVPLDAVPANRPVHMYCWYMQRCGAVRTGDLKFVYHFDERPGELFDIASDPLETNDLAAERPEDAAAMRTEMLTWLSTTRERHGQ